MKYGDEYTTEYTSEIAGKTFLISHTYKRAQWHEYHTNNQGDGLWCDDKQILGTCQFTVAGCKTEKAAIAKIRRYVMM